jgi:4-amino-4-deoxy-L-arabinose transferase-like glycosyltransferase
MGIIGKIAEAMTGKGNKLAGSEPWGAMKLGGRHCLTRERLLIAGVIVLAVIVQLSYMRGYPVRFEQSQVLYLTWDFLTKGIFPVHGILNSLQAYNPPFFAWLYLVPIMLSRDPSWVLILPAIFLYVLSILLLYNLGRRYFGWKIGLFAAILYAFSTRGLYFGHASWAQGLLPHFYVLIMFCSFQWIVEGKSWYVVLLLPLAAWVTGHHWGGALTFGVMLIMGWLLRAKVRLISVIVGGLIALALWAPFLKFEQDRKFVDLLVFVKGRLSVPQPGEITPFCGEEKSSEETGLINRSKVQLRSDWPAVYVVARALSSLIATFCINFHWAPYKILQSFSATSQQQAFFVVETIFFLVGLGGLLYKLCIRKAATQPEYLLIFCFVLPACLQNLTPYPTLSRPDISYLYYGPQVLIVAYVWAILQWVKKKALRNLLIVGLVMLMTLASHNVYKRLSISLNGRVHPQRQMVDWIAEDLRGQDRQRTSIRYDFLRDKPRWCWIVSYSALKDTYYIGAQHDYLLYTLYGIENTERTPDGWALNPDYIILVRKGLHRYEKDLAKYQKMKFGKFAVLKVLK